MCFGVLPLDRLLRKASTYFQPRLLRKASTYFQPHLLPTPLEPYNKDRMKQPHLKPEFKMKRKQPYLKPLYKQPNPKLVYKRKTETKRSRLPLYKFKRAEDHHIQCRHDRCAPLLPPFSPVISASQEQQIPPVISAPEKHLSPEKMAEEVVHTYHAGIGYDDKSVRLKTDSSYVQLLTSSIVSCKGKEHGEYHDRLLPVQPHRKYSRGFDIISSHRAYLGPRCNTGTVIGTPTPSLSLSIYLSIYLSISFFSYTQNL